MLKYGSIHDKPGVLQISRCVGGAKVGQGGHGIVQIFLSPMFPGTVVKTGTQERLQQEADMMARMRHPGVVLVYAVMRDHREPDPSKTGYLIMERMGRDLVSFQDGRSASDSPASPCLHSIEYDS